MKPHLFVLLFSASICFGDLVQHRGVWLHPREFNTQQLVDETIARVAAARLNVIYPLVWYYGGTAWFKSALSPMPKALPEGFDPLGALVKAAHAKGIHVHAWFVNGSYGSSKPSGLFEQHPDWQLKSGRGGELWYDLGKPEVRDFQRDLMLECLKNYEVDGIHFDYIRYSGQTMCFCDHCQNEFSQKYGFRSLNPTEEKFPALLDIGGNPVGKPTTAKVLATFDDGVPAIAVNRLGEGETVLVNWNAASRPCMALDNFVKETLKRFGATSKNTFQLHTTQTAAKYDASAQDKAATWLREIGFPAKKIDEAALAKASKKSTLILAGQYLINADTAGKL